MLQNQMLQGFITTTNFTTWQRHFRWVASMLLGGRGVCGRWDSLHPAVDLKADMSHSEGERVCDHEGTLAAELNSCLYDGNPAGEGVVWPTVAGNPGS